MYIKKQRHHFTNKELHSQSCGFSSSHVWVWELDYKEGWSPKNFGTFELWCWRRFLRAPWTTRRSNQSILKNINPEYSLEGLILNLKFQYFGQLMWRADSLEKTLMLRNIKGYGITDSMDMSLKKLRVIEKDRETWHAEFMGLQTDTV